MNQQETAALIMMMREYYPRDISATNVKTKVAAWELVLKDLSFDIASQALIAFVANDMKGFPPSPGQIIASARNLEQQGKPMSEMEAWGFVSRALRNSIYSSEEEFDKLPDLVKSVVHDPACLRAWAMMDPSTVESVIQSNFMRSFRARETGYREWCNIPEGIRALASGIQFKALPDINPPSETVALKKRKEMQMLLMEYRNTTSY